MTKMYECVHAASKFYTVGKHYELVTKEGKKGFIGDDGIFDKKSVVMSKFKEIKDESTDTKE